RSRSAWPHRWPGFDSSGSGWTRRPRAVAPLITIVRNWSVLAGAQVVSSLIAMVFLIVVSRTLGEIEFGRLYLALTLTAIVGVVEPFCQLLGALFQAHEQMLIPAIARVGGNVITLALVVPLLFLGHGAAMVATVIVVAAAARVGFQAIAARRLSGFRLPAPAAPSWRAMLRAGFPFLTANGFALFVARVDVLILGQLAGAAAVGWYGAASRLVEAFYFLP